MLIKNKFMFVVIILTGLIVGSYIGILLSHVLPEGIVKKVLLISVDPAIGNQVIDLLAIKISFGISININLCSLIGLAIAAWIYRWY